MVKNPPDDVGDLRDTDLIPGMRRSPGWEDPLGEGNGNLLQYFCLENSLGRGAWWTVVHGVTKSWARLSSPKHPQERTGLRWSADRPGKSHRSLKRSLCHHRMATEGGRGLPWSQGGQWLRTCPSTAGDTGLILAPRSCMSCSAAKRNPTKNRRQKYCAISPFSWFHAELRS